MASSSAFSAPPAPGSSPAAPDAVDLTNSPVASAANDAPFDLSIIDLDLETNHITGPVPESIRDIPVDLPAVHIDPSAMAPFPTVPAVLHDKIASSSSSPASIHALVGKLQTASPYTADRIAKGLQDVLDYPALIELLPQSTGLPTLQAMQSMASKGWSPFVKYCIEPSLKASCGDYCFLDDGSLGVAPFLITSNWANTRDLFALAVASVGGDSVEARTLVQDWNSKNSAFGSIQREPWSMAYNILDSMGLMVHDDLLLHTYQMPLVFPVKDFGQRPAQQYGADFRATYIIFLLIRVLLSLRLGGSVELILSAEASEDMAQSLELGKALNLLNTDVFKIEGGEVQSSSLCLITCKTTGCNSLQISALSPMLCLHDIERAVLLQQDFNNNIFRSFFPPSLLKDEQSCKLAACTSEPLKNAYIPDWVDAIMTWADTGVTMKQSDRLLYQTNSLLFVKACGFIEENGSLVMQVTGMHDTALEGHNTIAACSTFWQAKAGLSVKYCDQLLLSDSYPLLPGDIEAASTFLLQTGDAKRILKKSTAFAKVSQIGRACLMAQLILYGHARTISKLENNYHHEWVKVSEGKALLSSSLADAMWSYAGLLASRHEQWPADDPDAVLKLVLSHVSARETSRAPMKAKQQSTTYRQSNNVASKKSRVAKKAQDPVAFARKGKASNAKSVKKAKETRGDAQVESETRANKLRPRVKDYLQKKGFVSEAAKLMASMLVPYARGQTVPWRATDDMTKVPKGDKVQELLEKARADLKTFSPFQAWVNSSEKAKLEDDVVSNAEGADSVEQPPLAGPSSMPEAHAPSALTSAFPTNTDGEGFPNHFSEVKNGSSILFHEGTTLSDEETQA